jgi:uncharacterized protein YmfQ (DUF2313 family)
MPTEEEQTQSLANYITPGKAFAAKDIDGTVTRDFLKGLAAELVRVDAVIAELREETIPDETTLFVDEWESALGIPDACLLGQGTLEERRRDVLVKLASLGAQTAEDFVAIAEMFGVSVIIAPGGLHGCFPFKFPIVFFPDEQTARFTIIVDFTGIEPGGFPYTFPITFVQSGANVIECLFRKLKPANADLLVTSIS